jgi:hypothetical protein
MHVRGGDSATYGGDALASPRAQRFALLLLAMLLFPAARRALEATMLGQMVLQIPLLATAGWFAASFLSPAMRLRIARWDVHGVTGFVVASFTAACWMLPRALDAAVAEPSIDAAKYLSVPLLIGLPLSLSWPHAGFVARGVLVTEAIASLLRLGWLYRISPQRLCSAYPLADQQQVGLCLLALGGALFAVVAWRLLFSDQRAPHAVGADGMIA